MKIYDPNPDVNEVLVYSGAGAAARKRDEDARHARFVEISRESFARAEAHWAAEVARERREARVLIIVFGGLILLMVALVVGALAWR